MTPAGPWQVRTATKVNLHLGVGPRREDGYHPLVTVFQMLDLGDRLTLQPAPAGRVELRVCGPVPVPAGPDNLVHRAVDLVLEAARRRDGVPRGAILTLLKTVPAGAGLGGGSGDAGAALLLLDGVLGLGLGRRRLLRLARRVGADVPFFLEGGLASGRGRGDRLRPLAPLPAMHVLVATPPWPLSTSRVYGWFDRRSLTSGGDGFRMRPALESLRRGRPMGTFRNDLEAPVFRRHPDLARARDHLLAAGALVAGLSGSGSSIFGLFHRPARMSGALRRLREGGWEIRRCRTLSGPAYRARFESAAGRK